jgi:hypothetical protein
VSRIGQVVVADEPALRAVVAAQEGLPLRVVVVVRLDELPAVAQSELRRVAPDAHVGLVDRDRYRQRVRHLAVRLHELLVIEQRAERGRGGRVAHDHGGAEVTAPRRLDARDVAGLALDPGHLSSQ